MRFKSLLALSALTAALVFSVVFASAASEFPTSAYRREIIRDGGLMYYVVGPRAPHLFMISRDVYGDEHRWREIAEWNSIKPPYALAPGQKLLLKNPSTLTDVQANRLLIVAWSNLQQWETVKRIKSSEADEMPPPPAVEAVPAASPVPTPVSTAVPVATPEEKGTVIEASPLPEHEESEKPASRWHFAIAPLVSVAKLHSEFSDTAIKNTLNTDVDYGVDVDTSFRYAEGNELSLGVGVEHMDIKRPSSGVEIEGESQNLANFKLALRHEINHVSALRLAFIEDEEAFAKPTQESAQIVTVYIPQLAVGADWWLIRHEKFGLNLSVDGLALLPTKKDVFDFEFGYGAVAALNFENEFKNGKLIYGLSARYLNQSAVHVRTWQEMALAKLGWEF